jgi:ATP-binding cassette subfamily C (CFTR/MRP) protein 1
MFGSELCSGPLWDVNLTWYTDQPDFTPCFHKTVLVYLPCIVLWILAPLELWVGGQAGGRTIPWSWVNVTKLALDFLLVVFSGAEFCVAIWLQTNFDDSLVQMADLIGPIAKILTCCLDFALVYFGKRSGNKNLVIFASQM